jgi:glutathione synthase/RimK-type ligase-like ATP-grasp enzyme
MRKIKICISCINGFLTYDFIQSLKNQPDFQSKIIGIDISNRTKGKILADKFYQVSSPENEKKYIKDIIKIFKKEKFDIFFPLSDIENFVILKNKKIFKKLKINFRLPFNNYENAKLLYNKKNFLQFCEEKEIPVGKYEIVSNFKNLNLLVKKNFEKKYILKPIKGSGSKNVFLINNNIRKQKIILESRGCFETNLKILKKSNIFKKNSFILMPFYNGNIYDIDCIAENGKIKEFCIRLREIKNRFMFYSTGHRVVRNEKIKRLISKFVAAAKLDGICDFDVIEDKKSFYLLEASCRFSGSVGVCTKSGMNFPAQMVRYVSKMKKKKYKLTLNNSFRSFLVFKKIDKLKKNILLDDYIPHYSKQLDY